MKARLLPALLLLLPALALALAAPADSLYQFPLPLLTQNGERSMLDVDRGHPLLISMFYGTCPAACPLLISSMQAYEGSLDATSRARLRVLMVSFDAARDQPAILADLARAHHADPGRWLFTAAADPDARKLAALLGIQYRRLPDGGFEHSVLITLLDSDGRIIAQTTRLFHDEAFKAALRRATAAP